VVEWYCLIGTGGWQAVVAKQWLDKETLRHKDP
jgi:hypothetical protein